MLLLQWLPSCHGPRRLSESVIGWRLPPSGFESRLRVTIAPPYDLGEGEREAIALAQELEADLILLDDAKARRAARSRGLRPAGTLAVLFEAAERGLLDFRQAVDELRRTTFYVHEELIKTLLDRIDDPDR